MANFTTNETYTISELLLVQYAGARVHPYATRVLGEVCKDFKLSVQGQRNVSEGFSNVPSLYTPDERLTIGWALDHIIRNGAVFELGYEHLALNCALCDTFYETYAAHIIYELCEAAAGPTDITPYFSQWLDIQRSRNGVLAMSGFGLLVEDYIRLDPYNFHAGDLKHSPEYALPKAIADALRALADILSGRQKQLTIRGGPVIGWFAAIGEWLYSLRVAIFSTDGQRLHCGHDGQETQLLIVFEKKLGLHIDRRSWTYDNQHAKDSRGRAPSSHHDPPPQPYAQTVHSIPFGGRVTWQSLLPNVFGRAFQRLDHEESKTLGLAIGGAAVAFRELAEGGKDVNHVLSDQAKATPSSYGEGLIQTLTNWLPELRRHQGRMERQLKLSFEDGRKSYFDQIHHLQSICACATCSLTPDTTTPPKDGYCLTTLVEAIIALGLLLSRTTVASNLYPTRSGIQSFYTHQCTRRVEARSFDVSDLLHFTITYGQEWNAPDIKRLKNCVEIFSGVRPKRYLPENCVAVSHEGICAFLVKLQKPNKKEGEGRLISVLTGSVNVRCKVYTRAALGVVEGMGGLEDGEDGFWERFEVDYLDEPLYLR